MTDLPKPAIEAAVEIERVLAATNKYFSLGRIDRTKLLAAIIASKMKGEDNGHT